MASCVPSTESPGRYYGRREYAREQKGERLGDAAEQISTGLLSLTRQGGESNFMIIGAGDDYVQFLGRRGDSEVECELASPMLDDCRDARRGKLVWLTKCGFKAVQDCLICKYLIAGERAAWEVAQGTILLLRSLYGFTPETRIHVKLVLE